MTQENREGHGPHPDPPVDENLEIVDDETDPQSSGEGPHPDPDDDEVDEAGKESFPTSDPPSSWAGSDGS